MNAEPTTFEDRLESLHAVSQEIRLKLHLGSMDARDAWEELQPRLYRLEATAKGAADDVLAGLETRARDLAAAFESVRERLVAAPNRLSS